MTFEVLIAIWCVVLCVWLWIRPKHEEPPTYPGYLPVIGHAHILATNDLPTIWQKEQMVHQSAIENGGVVKVYVGPVPVYILTDPDDCHHLSNTCIDKPYLYDFGKEMYGMGLVTADPHTWKVHRKLLNPVFNQQVLYSFVEVYSRVSTELVSYLECKVGKDPFDIQPYLRHSVLTMAYHTTIGVDNSYAKTVIDKYGHATEDIFELFFTRGTKVWFHLPELYKMSLLKKQEDMLIDTLQGITTAAVKQRKLERKLNIKTANYKPLLDYMLELAETQDAYTDEEIRAQLDTLLTATYDTTSKSLIFIFILIGSYPEVQDRIVKELQGTLGVENRDLRRHDLSQLVYLEAVIKEVLRLYPVIPRVGRVTTTAVKACNYTIPAGSILGLSLYGINRHPVWGPDANEFKPERWLNPDSLPTNRNAFASFSLGKRNCIGKVAAMLLMKTLVANVLRKYKIKADIDKVKFSCDLLLKTVSGDEITLEMRT